MHALYGCSVYCWLTLCVNLLQCSTIVAEESVPANDSRIHYAGRWFVEDTDARWCAWQGSSFKLSFEGKQLSANIRSEDADYLRVIIDDDHEASRRLALNPQSEMIVLADGLEHGKHTIEVVKETYLGSGRMRLQGLQTSGSFLKLQKTPPELRIAFFGDSNLAGYSLGHERNNGRAAYIGCHFTFAGIAARMLGAEYQNVSVSGAVISGSPNSVLSFHDGYERHPSGPKWDFEMFQPDVCVLNIGANDIERRSQSEIMANYHKLLTQMRRVYPAAHIVVMNGYGWSRAEPANYTEEVVKAFNDENVSRCVFPWFFNEWHGCEYDHGGMAHDLVSHLQRVDQKWKPVRAADVFDGFGTNGNVANGSFEFQAPFGGFGWRYRDGNVNRQHAPTGAPDGDFYLTIHSRAEVHQPSPIGPGEEVQVNFMLRSHSGATNGVSNPREGEKSEGVEITASNRALVTVEFRDQEWRHSIPGTELEFKFNSTDRWQPCDFRFRAPKVRSKDASREPWHFVLKFSANEKGIDIDDVRVLRMNKLHDVASSPWQVTHLTCALCFEMGFRR